MPKPWCWRSYAFPPEMFDPYRERLKRDAGIDYVVLSTSHSHNTPERSTLRGRVVDAGANSERLASCCRP